jgi:hypothetical protein
MYISSMHPFNSSLLLYYYIIILLLLLTKESDNQQPNTKEPCRPDRHNISTESYENVNAEPVRGNVIVITMMR